jgi:hypothetical protein
MKFPDESREGSATHAVALRRLDEARAHESDMHDGLQASKDTLRELPAATQLAAASEKTAAREAWVSWIERDY